jgi:hypothetical protein
MPSGTGNSSSRNHPPGGCGPGVVTTDVVPFKRFNLSEGLRLHLHKYSYRPFLTDRIRGEFEVARLGGRLII